MFYKLHSMLGWWYIGKVGWASQVFFPGTVCNHKSLEITVVNDGCGQDLHAALRTAVVSGPASNFRA